MEILIDRKRDESDRYDFAWLSKNDLSHTKTFPDAKKSPTFRRHAIRLHATIEI